MQVGLGKETKTTITLGFTKANELFVGRLASALQSHNNNAKRLCPIAHGSAL